MKIKYIEIILQKVFNLKPNGFNYQIINDKLIVFNCNKAQLDIIEDMFEDWKMSIIKHEPTGFCKATFSKQG